MTFRIVAFETLTDRQRGQAADILRAAFTHQPAAFSGPGEPEAEVASFGVAAERSALAAVRDDLVIGWIGLIETYSHAWEMHPLAVHPAHQRRGVGTALVAALEAQARGKGVLTIYLGSDDDFGGTNLFGQDLFPHVAGKLDSVAETAGHAFGFYRRQGYEVVGVIPDANGAGKPDILMAKRLS